MNIKKIIKELYPYVVILVVVVIVRTYFVSPIRVSGDSMLETLTEGDILLLNKYDSTYERFDIVVISSTALDKDIIKRVIGMPGEEIEIENGIVYINKEKFDDIYNNYNLSDMESIILGEDEYFVMGDNRANSLDSRSIGAINVSEILGTVTYGIRPFGSIE